MSQEFVSRSFFYDIENIQFNKRVGYERLVLILSETVSLFYTSDKSIGRRVLPIIDVPFRFPVDIFRRENGCSFDQKFKEQ